MRAISVLMACTLLCGCQRTAADAQARKEQVAVGQDMPDLFKINDFVFDRYFKVGYDKLSQPQKVFVCVWELEGEVNNGGFDQYYFNSSGDHALDATASLETIDAKHTANLVRQVNALFGEAGPSADRFARQKQLDALDDAKRTAMNQIDREFYKYKDKLGQLLEMFVSKNADAFRSK
ncbi:MAG TPA: DMP19 family protein [Gemmataceae bacterium]|jgi:hypothetical protein|nr:DMP19 family protein [Gemmataceae bacterium]